MQTNIVARVATCLSCYILWKHRSNSVLLLQDSFDKRLPSVIFGAIAVIAGLLALVLPETLNQPMPQTLEDGEKFGQGDTAFNACCIKRSKGQTYDVPLPSLD